jgi:hypothetical protein
VQSRGRAFFDETGKPLRMIETAHVVLYLNRDQRLASDLMELSTRHHFAY